MRGVKARRGWLNNKSTSKKISDQVVTVPIEARTQTLRVSLALPSDLEPQALGYQFLFFYFLRIRADVPWARDPLVDLLFQLVEAKAALARPSSNSAISGGFTTPVGERGIYEYLRKHTPNIQAKGF